MRTTALVVMYVAAAVLGTYITFRPTFDSGFARFQTDRGDGMLNHLFLENSWLALTDSGYCGGIVTVPFCYPERGTIYYSENLFGSAPLYWALRLILPYDLAYMWWQITLMVLNFVAAAIVSRWFRFSHVLAMSAAFLWAFALVHMDQIKHQQMIGRMWMPFALYYAVTLVAEPSTKSLNRLLGSTFLQCSMCFYSGWFLVMGLAVFLPTLVMLQRGSLRELWKFTVAHRWAVVRIVAAWSLAMAALFGPYLIFSPSSGHEYSACFGYLPTPAAWITGPSGSYWEQTLAPYSKPQYYEAKLFSGFTIYALMLVAVVHLPFLRRDPRPALWPLMVAGLITAAVWWLLTISTAADGESLWRIVRHLPGGKAVRVVARVYLVIYLFGGFAALAWLQTVTERISRPWLRAVVVGVVVTLLIGEQTAIEQHSFARAEFYPRIERSAADMKGAPVGYVIPVYEETPVGQGPYGEVFGMWVGLRANVPVLNGYSGVLPPGHFPFKEMKKEQMTSWLNGRYRGTIRVIDPMKPGTYTEVVIE